jgi:acyl carrier protein
MEETKSTLRRLIAEQLKLKVTPDEIRDDKPLFGAGPESLGLDSLDALDLTLVIEDQFGVEIVQEQLIALANLNAVAAFIDQRRQLSKPGIESLSGMPE